MNFKPLLATLLLLSGSAFGQGVQQGGSVTPGHAVQWTTNGTIQDAGTAASGTITSLGVTNNGGPGVCVNSAPITTDYNSICMAVDNTTGGMITVDNHGTATGGLSFVVNGTVVPIGGTAITVGGTNIVSGTNGYFLYNNAGLLGNINLFGTANTWSAAQAFGGGATVPTRSPGDSTTNAASTAFVQAAVGGGGSAPANSMVGNWTNAIGSTASNDMPSCNDTGGNHLNYVTGTGITCGSSINLPAFTGGDVTSSAGSVVLTIGPSRVTNGMILNGTIDLASKVSGVLAVARGGTGGATAAAALGNLGALPLTGGTMTGALILSSAIPGSALQAASKQYVDNLAAGLSVKQSVVAATTVNGTLATAYENGDVIDDVTLATNDRILIKNQSAQAENGIYTVNASGAPTRGTDLDVWSEAIGAFTFVTGGTAGGGTGWVAQAGAIGTINVTALPFAQYSANSVYTNGAGLSLSGNTFSIGAGQVTNAMLGGSIAAAKLIGSDIATVGTITSGTWHGTAIGAAFGGTGQDFSGSTGVPLFTAGTASVIGTSGSGNVLRVTGGTATSLTVSGALTTAATTATSLSVANDVLSTGSNAGFEFYDRALGGGHSWLWSAGSGTLGLFSSGAGTSLLTITEANLWTLFGGSLVVNPLAASLAQGLAITQTGPVAGVPNNHSTDFDFNSVVVTEAVNQTTPSTILSAFSATDNINGSSASGQRAGIRGNAILLAPTSPTNIQRDYTGGTFVADARANDNGTNTGAGALGNLYAINPIAVARSGATNLAQLTGGETDVVVLTGASVANVFGMSYVRGGDLQGAGIDAVIHTVSGPNAHWGDLIHIGQDTGGGLSVRNAIIETDGTVGTIAKGIDLYNGGTTTITGNAWTSTGAVIDGSGNAIFTAYWVAGVGNGVDCSPGGTPLNVGTAVVSKGIITHC